MCSRLDTTVFGVPTLPFCVRSPSFRNVGVRQQGGICKNMEAAVHVYMEAARSRISAVFLSTIGVSGGVCGRHL